MSTCFTPPHSSTVCAYICMFSELLRVWELWICLDSSDWLVINISSGMSDKVTWSLWLHCIHAMLLYNSSSCARLCFHITLAHPVLHKGRYPSMVEDPQMGCIILIRSTFYIRKVSHIGMTRCHLKNKNDYSATKITADVSSANRNLMEKSVKTNHYAQAVILKLTSCVCCRRTGRGRASLLTCTAFALQCGARPVAGLVWTPRCDCSPPEACEGRLSTRIKDIQEAKVMPWS